MKATLVCLLVWVATVSYAQKKSDQLEEGNAIRAVLAQQVADWNNFNIEGFMQGYWKSDSLLFIGAKITHGWDSTLARYKKSYPTKDAMGILRLSAFNLQQAMRAWLQVVTFCNEKRITQVEFLLYCLERKRESG
jgi:hypothetical protein